MRDDLKNTHARVMVLVHDTSSQCALRFCEFLCYMGDNLKNTHARVMVLVHDTASQFALQMYEVSLKYL